MRLCCSSRASNGLKPNSRPRPFFRRIRERSHAVAPSPHVLMARSFVPIANLTLESDSEGCGSNPPLALRFRWQAMKPICRSAFQSQNAIRHSRGYRRPRPSAPSRSGSFRAGRFDFGQRRRSRALFCLFPAHLSKGRRTKPRLLTSHLLVARCSSTTHLCTPRSSKAQRRSQHRFQNLRQQSRL